MKKILIVDDDPGVMTTLSDLLKESGYYTCGVSSGKEAIEKITSENFDLALLDIMMPDMDGTDVLPELKRLSPRTQVIMITGFSSVENVMETIKKGACDYITKPIKIDDLLFKIRCAFEKAKFKNLHTVDLDDVFNALSSSMRRNLLRLISARAHIRLAEIASEMKIADKTKLIFHLKLLKNGKLIEQDKEKTYMLTPRGEEILDCLNNIEKRFSG